MPRSRNIATPNSRRSHLNGPSSRPSEPPPSWPVLQPLIPTSSLDLETLIPDQILIIRNLFTSTLCKKLVSFLATLPLVTTPGKPKRGDALRVNDRFEVDDWGFAERLWRGTGLEELVMGRPQEEGVEEREGQDVEGHIRDDERRKLWGGEVLGLNPRVRVYRYGRGQFFGQHCKWAINFFLSSCSSKVFVALLEEIPPFHRKVVGGYGRRTMLKTSRFLVRDALHCLTQIPTSSVQTVCQYPWLLS